MKKRVIEIAAKVIVAALTAFLTTIFTVRRAPAPTTSKRINCRKYSNTNRYGRTNPLPCPGAQ